MTTQKKAGMQASRIAQEVAGWPGGSDEFVEAFAKGLALIEVLGEAQGALTLAEMAERTGLTRAGVRRLVLTLQTLRFANQKEGRFSLTPRVLRLGYSYLSSLGLRDIGQPVIEKLAIDAGEGVAISVLEDIDVVYVARADIRGLLRRPITVGSRLPAYVMSPGRVLLAGLEDEQALDVLQRSELTAFTRYTKTDLETLQKELRKVRQEGFAYVKQELELGICGLAVPVKDGSGRVMAALNLSSNLARYDERTFLKKFKQPLLDAAEQISCAFLVNSRP
jgi:IclR family pca regulon transcriptional regulator